MQFVTSGYRDAAIAGTNGLSMAPFARTAVAFSAFARPCRRAESGLAAIAGATLAGAAFGAFDLRRFARGFTHFTLQPDGAAGGIEHLEQGIVGSPGHGVGWRIAELVANQLCGFQNGVALPALQGIDAKNA